MIHVTEDGYIIISRCDYLYRNGERNNEDYKRMGDGDIIATLCPQGKPGHRDLADAKEIVNYLNQRK